MDKEYIFGIQNCFKDIAKKSQQYTFCLLCVKGLARGRQLVGKGWKRGTWGQIPAPLAPAGAQAMPRLNKDIEYNMESEALFHFCTKPTKKNHFSLIIKNVFENLFFLLKK